jgi:hypothetical protein
MGVRSSIVASTYSMAGASRACRISIEIIFASITPARQQSAERSQCAQCLPVDQRNIRWVRIATSGAHLNEGLRCQQAWGAVPMIVASACCAPILQIGVTACRNNALLPMLGRDRSLSCSSAGAEKIGVLVELRWTKRYCR